MIGAAAATGVGLATDNFNPRTVAISGAFGAIPGSQGLTIGRAAAVGVAGGATEDIASQIIVDGVRYLNPASIAITAGTIPLSNIKIDRPPRRLMTRRSTSHSI